MDKDMANPPRSRQNVDRSHPLTIATTFHAEALTDMIAYLIAFLGVFLGLSSRDGTADATAASTAGAQPSGPERSDPTVTDTELADTQPPETAPPGDASDPAPPGAGMGDTDTDGHGHGHGNHDHGGGHGGHTDPGQTPPPCHGMPSPTGPYVDITAFGVHHGTSSHTHTDSLEGGRTAITTEAQVAYNGLRAFLGLEPATLEAIGTWAFDNALTNNDTAWGQDLQGVGLYYAMQGAKAGWIDDDAFDPQILADIQRTARLGEKADVMRMVETHGHAGFAAYLQDRGLVDVFVNTLKMEPHYGGWKHGRTHGRLGFDDEDGNPVATAHDLNHLTVLSHDQTKPFMNDTFDWPQWPALEVPEADVIDYFQSMVTLGDPKGPGITADQVANARAAQADACPLTAIATLGTWDDRMPAEEEDLEPV